MSDLLSPSPDGEVPPSMSFGERCLGLVFSPGPAFGDIVSRPDFLNPLILLIVVSVTVTETMLAKIGMERIVRSSLEQSSRAASMSPEQLDRAVEQGAKVGGILAHIGGVLGVPVILLIVAAVGLGILNGIFGEQLGFKPLFSVTCFAYLPTLLRSLMALAMILLGDPERFNAQNPFPTNPGFFLDPTTVPKPLYSLATSFDVFTLWFMALLGVGLSAAAGKRVRAISIFLIFLGIWMVLVLGRMAVAALM